MTRASVANPHYLECFQRLERSLVGEPSWLGELRRQAIASFERVGLPTARKGNEPWKYTNVAPIARTEFRRDGAATFDPAKLQRAAPWDDSWATVVFVNGRGAALPGPRTPADLRLTDLLSALGSDGSLSAQHLGRYASWEDDGFVALNTAFFGAGAFVQVAPGAQIATPVHLVFATVGDGGPLVSYPRALIVVGENSRLTLIETYVGLTRGSRHLTDAVTEVVLGEGAQVEHYRVLLEGDQAFHVGVTRVHQGRNSEFASMVFQRGAALARNDLRVALAAPGASCSLNGLYVTTRRQHIDNYINIDHAQPHTTSRLYYKGILDGASRAVFGGIVLVRPGAIRADAHQADKNLILSPQAEVDSKPSLEIYADDVKCGHGATAGAVAEDALFYLRSRGLDLHTASALLIRGFAGEVLETVGIVSLRRDLERRTMKALKGAAFAEGM